MDLQKRLETVEARVEKLDQSNLTFQLRFCGFPKTNLGNPMEIAKKIIKEGLKYGKPIDGQIASVKWRSEKTSTALIITFVTEQLKYELLNKSKNFNYKFNDAAIKISTVKTKMQQKHKVLQNALFYVMKDTDAKNNYKRIGDDTISKNNGKPISVKEWVTTVITTQGSGESLNDRNKENLEKIKKIARELNYLRDSRKRPQNEEDPSTSTKMARIYDN